MPRMPSPLRGTKSLPPSERPRERCLALGPEALSEVELLAILLGTGSAGNDVQDVARAALRRFGSLERLAAASAHEIADLPGFGSARAALLKAALELGRRSGAAAVQKATACNAPAAVEALLRPRLANLKQETFVVLCLDTRKRLVRQEVVTRGLLTTSLVHPREVFAVAIREAAACIVVAHNHPSGNPEPSDEDRVVTRRLEEAGRLLGIPFEDHMILARQGSFSFRAAGLLAPPAAP